jgi:hypothetical protein
MLHSTVSCCSDSSLLLPSPIVMGQADAKAEFKQTISRQLDPDFLANLDAFTSTIDESNGDDAYADSPSVGESEMAEEEKGLWRSIWSQGRGILNTDRHVNADMLEMTQQTEEEDEEDGNRDEKDDSSAAAPSDGKWSLDCL